MVDILVTEGVELVIDSIEGRLIDLVDVDGGLGDATEDWAIDALDLALGATFLMETIDGRTRGCE
jgi:hypothetical protein